MTSMDCGTAFCSTLAVVTGTAGVPAPPRPPPADWAGTGPLVEHDAAARAAIIQLALTRGEIRRVTLIPVLMLGGEKRSTPVLACRRCHGWERGQFVSRQSSPN